MVSYAVLTTMQFEDGSEDVIQFSYEAQEYFGISVVVPSPKTIEKKGYSYNRISGNDLKLIQVPRSRYVVFPKFNKRTVRKVRVPREEFSEKGNARTFTFSFPKRMKNLDITIWLSSNLRKHKPLYFLTEAGKARPVFDW